MPTQQTPPTYRALITEGARDTSKLKIDPESQSFMSDALKTAHILDSLDDGTVTTELDIILTFLTYPIDAYDYPKEQLADMVEYYNSVVLGYVEKLDDTKFRVLKQKLEELD